MNFEDFAFKGIIVTWALRIVAAGLIFLIGTWVAKRICKLFTVIMERHEVDVTLIKFLRNILYYALLVAVIIAAASQLGINTSSFLAVIGAAGLAIGLALKDSLSNFSAGVMLILFRPFKVGDAVTIAGETGKVEEITIFNTVLNTFDNQKKIIPNGTVASGTITNITANDTRRIDLIIGISYDDDIKKADQVLHEVVKNEEHILADPEVSIAVAELADSSVNFAVRPWVKTPDYWTVRCSLIENIKIALDEAGITIPYPQQDVYLHQVDADGDKAEA